MSWRREKEKECTSLPHLPHLLGGDIDLFKFAVCFSSFQPFLQEGKKERKRRIRASLQEDVINSKGRGEQEAPGPAFPAQPVPAEYSGLWFSTCNKTGLCWRVTSKAAKETEGRSRAGIWPQVLVPSPVISSTSPPSPIHLRSPGEYH